MEQQLKQLDKIFSDLQKLSIESTTKNISILMSVFQSLQSIYSTLTQINLEYQKLINESEKEEKA